MTMKKINYLLAILGLGVSICSPSMVCAADLLETLRKNGAINQKQYQELLRQQHENEDAPRGGSSDVIVTTSGGLAGKSPDGAFTTRIRGRVLVDAAFYNRADDGEEPGNGTEIRRARISVDGRAWNDWEYEVELDLGEDQPEIVDAFVRYIGVESWDFRIGHIKEPFSLEEQTGSNNITFMERALPNTFAPDRNIGIDAQTFGENWTFVVGFFGEGPDNEAEDEDDDELDEGLGLTSRVTYNPLLGDDSIIHLGASFSYRQVNDEGEVRFRERPESHISGIRLANTGKIQNVEDFNLYGLEAAAIFGSLSIQAEYITAELNRESGLDSLSFDGFYVYASYILTGEIRSFRDSKGEFGGVTPKGIVGKGGSGAWEVGLRLSNLNLNDMDIDGGEENNMTLGLNWYAAPNVRFMINLVHAESEQADGTENDDLDILQARAQLSF